MQHFKQQLYRLLAFGTLVAGSTFLEGSPCAFGQTRLPDVQVATEWEQQVRLAGSTSPRTVIASDAGRASGNEALVGLTLSLKQTPLQAEALKKLLAEQQTFGTPNYHRWLNPKEYGEQFGLGDDGIKAITEWLLSQGFTHAAVNASRTAISFNGSLARVEQVFKTEFHRYGTGNQIVLANAVDLRVPANLSRFVDGISHTSQFRPTPQAGSVRMVTAPKWTSAGSGGHFLTPADLARIYDFTPLSAAGSTGQGQQIAVVGQSAIDAGDIARFRASAGLNARQPQLVLVPDTGSAVRKPGDEIESDIDLEYAGAAVPDADLIFVYTGTDPGHTVFDALSYAVDRNLAPVISVSYGQCEETLSRNEIAALEKTLMQASAQGQTVVASSGDLGATACEAEGQQNQGPAAHGLAVQYPASSAYVTSVGGTMFSDADAGTFWTALNGTDGVSARSYIAEQAWSEDRGTGQVLLFASGGGASSLFSKPSWQAAAGVPTDGARDVPDIALAAGARHDGYVFCSSDSSLFVHGSCSRGFLDASGLNLTVAGGTSFSAPVVAGIAALLNQMSGTGRLGNLNPLLYPLAAVKPSVFHDIVAGSNRQSCTAGSDNCDSDGTEGYDAGQGYDPVTGLGTPDVGQLAAALVTLAETAPLKLNLSLRQLDTLAYAGTAAHFLATLVDEGAALDGQVQFSIDGVAYGPPVPLKGGQARGTLRMPTPGTHTVSALLTTASGVPAAAAQLLIVVASQAEPASAFTLSSTTNSPLDFDQAASAITIASSSTYSGQVIFTAATADAGLAASGCYSIPAVRIMPAAAGHAALLVGRSAAACSSMGAHHGIEIRRFVLVEAKISTRLRTSARSSSSSMLRARLGGPLEAVSACCVLCLAGIRRRRFRLYSAGLIAIFSIVTTLTGCAVSVTPRQANSSAATIVLTGSDAVHPSTSASIGVSLLFGQFQ